MLDHEFNPIIRRFGVFFCAMSETNGLDNGQFQLYQVIQLRCKDAGRKYEESPRFIVGRRKEKASSGINTVRVVLFLTNVI